MCVRVRIFWLGRAQPRKATNVSSPTRAHCGSRIEIRMYNVICSTRVCDLSSQPSATAQTNKRVISSSRALWLQTRDTCVACVICQIEPAFCLTRLGAAEQSEKRIISSSRAMWIQTRDTNLNCVCFQLVSAFFCGWPSAAAQSEKRAISSSRKLWIQTRDMNVTCIVFPIRSIFPASRAQPSKAKSVSSPSRAHCRFITERRMKMCVFISCLRFCPAGRARPRRASCCNYKYCCWLHLL